MILVVAKSMHTRGKLETNQSRKQTWKGSKETHTRRQIAPALLFVAFLRMARRGPAEELITLSRSAATKSSTTRKIEPVTVPIMTQPIMILGPSMEGLGISEAS